MKRYQSKDPDRPIAVGYEGGDVVVTLANGEVLRTPLSLHTWLEQATPEQRAHMEFDPDAVYFPELDDGLDIEWMRQAVTDEHDLAQKVRAVERDPRRRALLIEFLDLLIRTSEDQPSAVGSRP